MTKKQTIEISKMTNFWLLCTGGVISFSSIYQMGTSNAYVNTATDSFHIFLAKSMDKYNIQGSNSAYTWIWSLVLNIWFPGFALGSLIAIPITDNWGRKNGLLTGNLLTLLSVLSMAGGIYFHFIELFLIARFISAVSSAISMCALILLLQEISPLGLRGKMSFFAEMSFVLTNTIGMVMGMRNVLGNNLVVLTGSAILPVVLSIIIVLPLQETPKYLLLNKQNRDEAKKSIEFYLKLEGNEMDDFLSELQEDPLPDNKSFFEIFCIPHVRFGLFLGVLALQITTSLWPIVFYSTEFLRRTKISFELAEYVSSAMLIFSTISTFCGFLLVEKFARRHIFILSSSLNIACLIAFVVFSQLQKLFESLKYACCISLIGHSITYSFALGPVAWFITAELVPTKYRCVCQSIALAFNHLMAFALTLTVMPLYNLIDSFALIPLFVVPPILALVALYLWLPETKGRDIQHIVNELRTLAPNNSTGKERAESYHMKTNEVM